MYASWTTKQLHQNFKLACFCSLLHRQQSITNRKEKGQVWDSIAGNLNAMDCPKLQNGHVAIIVHCYTQSIKEGCQKKSKHLEWMPRSVNLMRTLQILLEKRTLLLKVIKMERKNQS